MGDVLQELRDMMAKLPARKEWADMTPEERLADALARGAEVVVSQYFEPGHVAAHKRTTFLTGYHQDREEYVVYVADEATRDALLAVRVEASHG